MDLHQHLLDRHLEVERYSGIMVMEDVVVFPLWNLSGQMVGYLQYRPGASKQKRNNPREGRYYTSLHGNKNEKPLAVWGLESLSYDPRYLVIVEGIFDACRLHNYNVPAVALLTASSKHAKNWLNSLGRKIYKIDDDHASKLGPYPNIELPINRADVGECSHKELDLIIIRDLWKYL